MSASIAAGCQDRVWIPRTELMIGVTGSSMSEGAEILLLSVRCAVPTLSSEVSDLRDWMMDDLAREQFVCRFDQGDNEIYWHNSISNQAELEYDGERERKGGKVWCDSKVQWSPRGSYLATFHRPGIALWGPLCSRQRICLAAANPWGYNATLV